jgi:DNA-binding response OmpR family regulator
MARVLLAESDRRIRDFIAGILIDCGHAVEICADGIEATASLSTKGIDVVVTDLVLSLGQGNGLRQNCAELGIPTITLSGCEFRPGQAAARGPSMLLEKPFRFADLQSVLEAVAVHSRSVASSVARAVAVG